MSVKIYVGNISFHTSSQELRSLFAEVGSVESCEIVEDRATQRSRGFAFVTMSSKAEAENAIAQLDGREFGSRKLRVDKAGAKPAADVPGSPATRLQDHFLGIGMRAYFKQPSDMFSW